MRRSAALLSLFLLFGACASHASAAPARAPAPALTIGIFEDPGTIAAVALWSLVQVARLATLADEVLDHVKEDVRRAQHPQSVPPLIGPRPIPFTPVLPPVRVRPIVDPLPVRPAS